MRSHRLSSRARVALLVAAAGLIAACAPIRHHPDAPRYSSPHTQYYDYRYYPAIDSYYDPRASVYIYFADDRWIRSRTLPAHVRPHLGHHVTIRSRHQRPYEQHRRHRGHSDPDKHRPQRNDKTRRGHRRDDVRIGLPRRATPDRDRHRQRPENGDRHRNGKQWGRDPGHRAGRGMPRQRVNVPQRARQSPATKPRDATGRRVPRSRAASESPRHRAPVVNERRPSRKTRDRDSAGRRQGPASTSPAAQDTNRRRSMRQGKVRGRTHEQRIAPDNDRRNRRPSVSDRHQRRR